MNEKQAFTSFQKHSYVLSAPVKLNLEIELDALSDIDLDTAISQVTDADLLEALINCSPLKVKDAFAKAVCYQRLSIKKAAHKDGCECHLSCTCHLSDATTHTGSFLG